MSVLLDSTPITSTGWTGYSGTAKAGIGCAGADALTCAAADCNKDYLPTHYAAMALRFQYAAVGSWSGEKLTAVVQDSLGTLEFGSGTLFQCALYLKSDGTIVLHFGDGSGGDIPVSSAAGAFPIDGHWHGVQIGISATATSADYTVTVDNVSVLSGTVTPTGALCSSSWGWFDGGHVGDCAHFHARGALATVDLRTYRGAGSPADLYNSALAAAQIDDDASVVTYDACSGIGITLYTCTGFLPVPGAPPTIPTVVCTPSTTVLTTPSPNPGCNQGGVGWTPTYLGPSGVVPEVTDPPDGDPLTGKHGVHLWAEITHTKYPSGDKEVLRYGLVELDDDERKEGRLITLGGISYALSDLQGQMEAAQIDLHISDLPDRPISTRLGGATTKYFQRDEILVKGISTEGRRLGAQPRILARGYLQKNSYSTGLVAQFTALDGQFLDGGAFGPDKTFPTFKIPDYYVNAPTDVYQLYMPVLYGEYSDEGAVDPVTNLPSSRGVIPARYVGQDGLPTGPGGATEIWGRFNICLFASYQILGLYGANLADGLYGMASATSDGADPSIITLPLTVDVSGLATDGSITITLFTAKGVQKSQITGVPAANQVQVNNQIAALDATNVDWIIGEYGQARTKIDITTRNGSDVMVFGYPRYVRSTPYEDISDSDGQAFRVTDIWVRGPLLDAHLNGTCTIAVNLIGIEDQGDGSGLPLTDYFVAYNHWWDNCVHTNSSVPQGPGRLWPQADGDLPAFEDGTHKTRQSTFAKAQAYTKRVLGGDGYKVGACFIDPIPMSDAVSRWNDNAFCRTGYDSRERVIALVWDDRDDVSTWPRIEHVSRVFGDVTREQDYTQIENIVRGPYDYDADAGKYRAPLVSRKSDDAITRNKSVIKWSKEIDGSLTRDLAQWTNVLDRRLAFMQDGPAEIRVSGCDIGLLDYELGTGILFTSLVGPSALGYVDRPMYLTKMALNVETRLVDLLLTEASAWTPLVIGDEIVTICDGVALVGT